VRGWRRVRENSKFRIQSSKLSVPLHPLPITLLFQDKFFKTKGVTLDV
jgi:hypothetical protein